MIKKLLLLAFLFNSADSFSQVQRLVLTEEFTNANAGPCAAQNPYFNALLLANPNKIVAIKYHTDWPFQDVFYNQNPTEMANRISYYGVMGVPMAYLNGSTNEVAGPPAYAGSPMNYSQSIIDNAYSVPSSFSINLNHSFSPTTDSIYITCNIVSAQQINIPQFFLRMAIVEKHMHFNTSPGNNGESDFYYTMRKMVPDASGVSIPADWTPGQTQSLMFALPVPGYIHDYTELAVVAFLQEDISKAVQQAAISQPVPFLHYARVTRLSLGNDLLSCSNAINPTIKLQNEGTQPFVSADITCSIDGGPETSYPFTGNVPYGDSVDFQFALPGVLAEGPHTMALRINNINGTSIHSQAFTETFHVIGSALPANSFSENFVVNSLVNNHWISISNDNTGFSWNTLAGYGNPKGALKMDFWNSSNGRKDEIILPPVTCGGAGDATIAFKISAKGYLNGNVHSQDTLMLKYSSDCGASWSVAWMKSGTLLATGSPTYSATEFTGEADGDYRNESALLPGTANAQRVLIKFVAISDWGNNAFIDDINISAFSQRRLLTEEFTNANSGPCAAQNNTFNSLLMANQDKIVGIRYQVNWPQPDPMNIQNSSEIASRVNYYGVVGVPVAYLDGSTNAVSPSGTYPGAPVNYNQAIIDSAYAVPDPFSINLSHSISCDMDSIYISCTANALEPINLSQLFLRLAIIEKHIHFTTAPGTNGETDFYYVMRKLIPDAVGTPMVSSWVQGQNQTFTFSAALPGYIYNPLEIAVVAFIQEDAGKSVLHTALSEPVGLPNYVVISNVSDGNNPINCDTLYQAGLTISNQGTTTLTNCVVSYSLDGSTAINIPFAGYVPSGSAISFPLPDITVYSPGQHILNITITNINGSGNHSVTYSKVFYLVGNSQMGNTYTENFNGSSFPYTNWIDMGTVNGFSRNAAAGFGNPKGALKMDYYNTPNGRKDEILLPPYSCTGLSNATLSFKIAAKGYLNGNIHSQDTLSVLYSLDCGNSWNIAWQKAGALLATGNPTTLSTEYTATTDADFRNESVLLSGTSNAERVLLKFVGISDYGNNAYIDNINLGAYVLTNLTTSNEINRISLYPNPANTKVFIDIEDNSAPGLIQITDATGKKVYQVPAENNGKQILEIPTSEFCPGIYFVKIQGHTTQKLVVTHNE